MKRKIDRSVYRRILLIASQTEAETDRQSDRQKPVKPEELIVLS